MRKFVMSIEGELPDDEMEAAETLVKLKSVRKAAEEAIEAAEMTASVELKTSAVRAPSEGPRAPRGSRTKSAGPAVETVKAA